MNNDFVLRTLENFILDSGAEEENVDTDLVIIVADNAVIMCRSF